MKYFKYFREYPFMTALIVSSLLLTLIGYMGKNNVYAGYPVNLWKVPLPTVVLEGVKDGNYPWKTEYPGEDNMAVGNSLGYKGYGGEKGMEGMPGKSKIVSDGIVDNNKADNSNTGNNTDKSNTNNRNTYRNKTSRSNDHGKPFGTGHDKKQNGGEAFGWFETVEKSYFDNALFIGDSRTVGLSEYSGWDNPTYYADVGLTIYDVFDKEIAEADGRKTTIVKALKQQSFKKIYIMLGINELGRGTTETFIEEYKKVIEKLQKLQPDAIIFVEGIMKVSKKKSDSDPIFNNKNIKDKNDHLVLLADNKDIFYIDVNEAIADKTGGIPEKYTFDNIHLKAAYYSIWTDFLLKHGVIREE